MEVSKRIFDLETESAFAVLAKANKLLKEGKDLYNSKTGKGENWYIYHTDPFYCKYYWRKGKCKIPNKSVYRFDATRGIKGNKEKLIYLLKNDELAYLKFKK